MHAGANTPHKKARIEIIPLIDIMFFLLASFMLVSMSMIKLQAIDTRLPAAQTSKPVDKPDFVSIGIDKAGKYYFNKEKDAIDPQLIPQKLKPFYEQKRDDLKVFINADADTSYETVVTVLDMVRAMGLKSVSFPVKKDNHFDPNNQTKVVPVAAPAAPAPAPGT